MNTHICTTGTSIARGVSPALFQENPESYRREIQSRIAAERGQPNFLQRICAETNGLSRCGISKEDEVILLHTETGDGQICAEAVQSILEEAFACDCRLVRIDGLQVRDPRRFRKEGVQNLFRTLDRLRNERWGRELRLNVTGGFKAVVPFMTLYGLIHRLDVVYLYESSSELITLPPIPVSFDFERIGAFRDAMRTLQAEEVMPLAEFEKRIPADVRRESVWMQALLDIEDGMVSPSGLAPLFFKELDEHAAQVLISPSAVETLAASTGGLRKQYLGMLERVTDPLWRDSKIHPVHGTDLSVFKPGNTSARMIAFQKGRRVFVCELALHDRYEELLAGRRVSDFPENSFQLYQAPADSHDLLTSEDRAVEELDAALHVKEAEVESLFKELEEKEQELTAFRKDVASMREELKAVREERDRAEMDSQGKDSRLEQYHREILRLDGVVHRLQCGLSAYCNLPAWRRLFTHPASFFPEPPSSNDNPETR